jgi:hypothetical protein
MRHMTQHEFRRALDALGMTQGEAAVFLGRSIRRVHGYANGDEIPLAVVRLLRLLVNKRIKPEASDAHIPAED